MSDRSVRSRNSTECAWKSDTFYHQECEGYFDCPGHTIERRLPIDEEGQPSGTTRSEGDLRGEATTSQDSSRPESLRSARDRSDTSTPELPQQLTTENWEAAQDPASPADTRGERSVATMDHLGENTHSSWSVAEPQPNADPTGRVILPERIASREARPPVEAPLPARPSLGDHNRLSGNPPGYHGHALPPAPRQRGPASSRRPSDAGPPRWVPDAEVTYCPICQTQFSFFVRKHHCRKCGRVVCNACSPHRIIIPHQYIVRPPGSEMPMSQSLLMDSLGVGYIDVNGMSGGERVRLCNPCVPDPNIEPPQYSTSTTPTILSPRSSHQRSRSSIGGGFGANTPTNRYGMVMAGPSHDPFQVRNRSITMSPGTHAIPGSSSRRPHPGSYISSTGRSAPSYPTRYSSLRNAPSSSRHRDLPPTPQIAEEDECPICHRELPSRTLLNFEAARESHINSCIQSHSTYGSPRPGAGSEPGEPAAAPRRTGMYTYPATEKDCVDDAECTICLEEFTVGVQMARLECLCRFHRSCIQAWFVNHPGRCPVHQHDGFGY